MMLNGWEIKVSASGMPQKVASAFDETANAIVGAKYEFIAYLGSQVVNGVNHAILAKQTLVTGVDICNVVLIVLNEKSTDGIESKLTVERIENVLAGGQAFGGIHIEPSSDIPQMAQDAWNEAFGQFVGSAVKPFAYLGSQMTDGLDYIFAATSTMIVRNVDTGVGVKFNGPTDVVIITVRGKDHHMEFTPVLSGAKNADGSLGYAFTW